jgi:hypothetical protein
MLLRFSKLINRANIPITHRNKMSLLAIVTAVVITIFQIQLAQAIHGNGKDFWNTGSASYSKLAYSLIEEGSLSYENAMPTAGRPPLYPLFLAGLLLLSEEAQIIVIAQSILTGAIFGLLTLITYEYTQKSWPTLFNIAMFVAIKVIAINFVV